MKKSKSCVSVIMGLVLFFALIVGQAPAEATNYKAQFNQADKYAVWYNNASNETGGLAWGRSYVLQAYLSMYRATGDAHYLNKFIAGADQALAARDSVRGVKDYRGLSLPAWRAAGNYTLDGKHYIFAVHTGMIAYPLADFADIVYKNNLTQYRGKADIYLQAAKDAVAVHADEWRESGNEGWYAARKGAPVWFDGIGVPFNMYLAMARTELSIYRATGEQIYLDRATKMARHFKNKLRLDAASGAYIWDYWWGPGYSGWKASSGLSVNSPSYAGYRGIEDLSHGAIDVAFAHMAFSDGIVFTEQDMQRFGNTVEKKLIRSDGQVNSRVDGNLYLAQAPSYLGMWLEFNPYAPSMFKRVETDLNKLSSYGAPSLLALAKLNLAANGGVSPGVPEDTIPPEVAIGSPQDNTEVTGIVPLTANASDNVKVESVVFEISQGGDNWQTIGSGVHSAGKWTYNWNTSAMQGKHVTIRAIASDTAGNESVSAVIKVSVQNRGQGVPDDVVVNGDFYDDSTVWHTAGGHVVREANGNGYARNGYNWQFYQDITVKSGDRYLLNALTRKGTGSDSARVVLVFIDQQGNRTVGPDLNYTHKGASWESIPAAEVTIPSGCVTVRLYLLSNTTSVHHFDKVSLVKQKNNDTTPPQVTEFNPADGTAIGYKEAFRATFSEDVSNVNDKTFYIESVPGKVTYNEANRVATLTPLNALLEGQTYRVHLTAGITDKAGNALSPLAYSFKVPETKLPDGEVIVNGNFQKGGADWHTSGGEVAQEESGNLYALSGYTWQFYQDIDVKSGEKYILKAQTRKVTGSDAARIVVVFMDAQGNRTVGPDLVYNHGGTGWENIPAENITIPGGAVKIRLYLLSNGSSKHGFNNVSMVQTASAPPQVNNLIVNGNFDNGLQGWSGGTLKADSNNKYAQNGYNWSFFQDVTVIPGATYVVDAQTKRGTGNAPGRMVLMFIDNKGDRTVARDITHEYKGSGWENIAQQSLAVPNNAKVLRVYLLAGSDKSTHQFDNVKMVQKQ